jgi:hypothetical protein
MGAVYFHQRCPTARRETWRRAERFGLARELGVAEVVDRRSVDELKGPCDACGGNPCRVVVGQLREVPQLPYRQREYLLLRAPCAATLDRTGSLAVPELEGVARPYK